jgi:hypothetical protein
MMTAQGMHKDRPSIYVKIDDERYLKLRYWRLVTADETTYGATITLHRTNHHSHLLGWAYQGTSRNNAFVVTRGTHTVEQTHDLPRAACRLFDAQNG